MPAPVLAQTSFMEWHGIFRRRVDLRISGGLRCTVQDELPRFLIECERQVNGHMLGRGSDYGEIVKRFPDFADLAALNLSDMNGVPMHAVGNGWYWLAGARGGNGEAYHGGRGLRRRLRADGRVKGEKYPSPDKCLAIFANHVRLSIAQARQVRDAIASKAAFAEWIELQKPRFKAEAEACRARHNLIVYGHASPFFDVHLGGGAKRRFALFLLPKDDEV